MSFEINNNSTNGTKLTQTNSVLLELQSNGVVIQKDSYLVAEIPDALNTVSGLCAILMYNLPRTKDMNGVTSDFGNTSFTSLQIPSESCVYENGKAKFSFKFPDTKAIWAYNSSGNPNGSYIAILIFHPDLTTHPNGCFKKGFIQCIDELYTEQRTVVNLAETLPSTIDLNSIEVNALPFRAYESIYNSFFRDQRNNPYVLNGVHDPNVFLPSTDGGIDPNEYKLRKRNWEQDFLTTAVPSPQQGVAPLVGIRTNGVATFLSEDGTKYNVQLDYASDGDTVTGANVTKDTPADVRNSLNLLTTNTTGISISDLRNCNALQRWAETNIRRGLKYKDQLASHFGVDPSYEVLDMPEFIGGTSQMVDIQQINQLSSSTADSPLGSYAGQASAVGGSKNSVQKFCDEHGFIIGLISVVPVPCYSQLLPKYYTKTTPLDYYFPEFGHIGLQPITYREVCPLQAMYNGISLNKTFGYQRAWYDYLSNTDQVHGQFRTTLRDMLLGRVFDNVPSLNEEFLTVDKSQLNNVFTVHEVTKADGTKQPLDVILGQMHFNITMKRAIPRYGVPKLE